MTLLALQSDWIMHASQDGSREFISLLTCICATETALSSALIYKSEFKSLQNTWLEDWIIENKIYFTVSTNEWSCDALDLDWLNCIFQRCTHKKAGNRRRLLIVDKHSSHVNMTFINICDQLHILLLILPSHITYHLQLLDIFLFASLAMFYTQRLNKLLFNSLDMTSISKRAFWSVFLSA